MTAIQYLENKIVFLEHTLKQLREDKKEETIKVAILELIKLELDELDRFQLLTSQEYRINCALNLSDNSKVKTAKLLGISERTVYRQLVKNSPKN
jgi:transcriptional regulator with PAS, ATPase and Fis domain